MRASRFNNWCWSISFFLITGCAATAQITNTPRSSIEQELLVRALDRALAKLDTQKLTDKTVAIDFYGLTPDKDFAREYFTAWLQSQRVRVTSDPRLAQVNLKVFASVLAVVRANHSWARPRLQSRSSALRCLRFRYLKISNTAATLK